ncbi:type II secretion system F family protein [Butyrivibrio sp. INlla16]|uniref:type II secretion system F family protein n=1 Tax=Butyrivibrio sp. INlla16 TaxID=1520807 RepID=UPI000880DE47|nr:type II secretion system F family protein [Butyrivibrio sp. INlla16]SDB15064.1 type IV pilus assembly protein PilC [Butyrivibrio sp. INlla16]
MNSYKYTALTSSGEKIDGMLEAIDQLEATAKIRQQYDVIVSIKEIHDKSIELPEFLGADIGGKKLDPKAFTMMCSQFATILSAGIPISRTVKLIRDKTTNKSLKNMLTKVFEDVEAGRALSAAFNEHGGDMLPATFCETLRAGEEAGDLAGSFDSIYKHFDKQTKMGAKVRSAMAYPLFVLCVAVVVVMILMVKVVPTFTAIFEELDTELPLITRALIGISNFFSKYILVIVIVIAVIIIGVLLFKRTPSGARKMSEIQLKLPVLGNIAELNAASLFANTMATMIGSGLPVTKSVSITSRVMTNEVYKQEIANMVGKIEEGRTVVDSMRDSGVMPDILTDMVGVGEETGEMKHTMDVVAKYYDSELEQAVAKAIAMLEPALLIFIAVVAGFIVIAIYMAMFTMYQGM